MKMLNQNNLSENIQKFILKLNYKENNFLPVQTGSTDAGRELNMGFTCYALKILYTIDSNYLDDKDWMTKIYNSLEGYKKNYHDLPDYSYVEPAYYRIYKSSFYKLWIKNIIKFLLMRIKIHEVNPRFKFKEFIRAETKQTIATMTQLFPGYVSDFKDFPHEIKDLDKFFNNLNWNSPWNAGAQVAGICVFLSSLKNNSKQISYRLVGQDEADIKKNLIFFKSPIGKALIGKDKGDMISASTPSGERSFEILDVEYI